MGDCCMNIFFVRCEVSQRVIIETLIKGFSLSLFSHLFLSFEHKFFWETFILKFANTNSSNVSMQNRSGSKIETKSTFMQLQATLSEKASIKGESEDNDDW